jgi:hypothetical protein
LAAALFQTAPEMQTERLVERWFFTGMAVAMIVGPWQPSCRR